MQNSTKQNQIMFWTREECRSQQLANHNLLNIIIIPDFVTTNQLELSLPENNIINELSWNTRSKLLNNIHSRRVGIESLRIGDETTENSPPPHQSAPVLTSEDSNMKIKLFRLMYETVRDSDLKVRRAELIRSHYANSSAFEIGFIFGDITDKYNVITDISKTLERLYKEWKPMEHINAYEQIANKGIEIGHLVEMVRIINKKNSSIDN